MNLSDFEIRKDMLIKYLGKANGIVLCVTIAGNPFGDDMYGLEGAGTVSYRV